MMKPRLSPLGESVCRWIADSFGDRFSTSPSGDWRLLSVDVDGEWFVDSGIDPQPGAWSVAGFGGMAAARAACASLREDGLLVEWVQWDPAHGRFVEEVTK